MQLHKQKILYIIPGSFLSIMLPKYKLSQSPVTSASKIESKPVYCLHFIILCPNSKAIISHLVSYYCLLFALVDFLLSNIFSSHSCQTYLLQSTHFTDFPWCMGKSRVLTMASDAGIGDSHLLG